MLLKNTKYLLISFISLFIIFILRSNVRNLFYELNTRINLLIISKSTIDDNCIPEEISKIPPNSAIIIGHAYGDPNGKNRMVSSQFKKFYIKNKKNIELIIFSGDVIRDPNPNKWLEFYSIFNSNTKFHISPGNHDLIQIKDKKYFKFSHKGPKELNFPYFFKWKKYNFVIDNSNETKTNIKKINKIINSINPKENIYVIRHHVLPRILKFASNNKKNQKFLNNKDLDKLDKNISFIYGDGGAYDFLPRIVCLKINGVKHIVNGIGDISGDTILVLTNKGIFKKIIY